MKRAFTKFVIKESLPGMKEGDEDEDESAKADEPYDWTPTPEPELWDPVKLADEGEKGTLFAVSPSRLRLLGETRGTERAPASPAPPQRPQCRGDGGGGTHSLHTPRGMGVLRV